MTNLIEVKELAVRFPSRGTGLFGKRRPPIDAVKGVTFGIKKGEALGLVGESGSGKTTLGRAILRLIEPTSGRVYLNAGTNVEEVTKLNRKCLRKSWRHMQMIFQDPYASLNPRITIMDTIAEPLLVNGLVESVDEAKRKVTRIAEGCGLTSEQLSRYPHAFSGGQRQRISIARALVMHPEFIVCDEPVSALDVSIQAQILNLLIDRQKEMNLTFLFISHDLTIVAYVCDRIAVMYLGSIIEISPTSKLFEKPLHPYTEALLAAIPSDNPDHQLSTKLLVGEPTIGNSAGCPFSGRCQYSDGASCETRKPALVDTGDGRMVACHYANDLALTGVNLS